MAKQKNFEAFLKGFSERQHLHKHKIVTSAPNKEEKRVAEMKMYRPTALPKHKEPSDDTKTGLAARSVMLIFDTKEDFEMFGRHLKVYARVENSVKDVDPIMAYINLLDQGILIYEKEKGIALRTDQDEIHWLG